MGRLSQVVNFRRINESGKEIRRKDYWLLEIETPKGIYFPGNELIQIRTNSFTTGISDDIQVLDRSIRGFKVKQGAKPSDTSGQMQLTLSDRIDQTISYFIDQWKQAIGNRDELSGLPKELYVSPVITATYFDINENPIRQIRFINCFLSTGGLPEDGDAEPSIEDELTISIDYEHFYREFKNV